MNKRRMPFIVFEGLDGSGLTTQASRLHEWLSSKGYEVFLTKEPTDGLIGSLIRSALRRELIIDPDTLALLFAADRTLHTKEISKLLNEGVIVISDRYRLSSFAFQSIEVELEWIRKINEKALTPDLTFIIDTPPLICLRRIQKQRFHMELYEEVDKLERIREVYHRLAEEERGVFLIDGNRPENVVSSDIFTILRDSGLLEGLE